MNEPCDNPTLSSDAITRVLRHLARTDAAQKTQYLLSVAQRARVYLLTQDEVTDLHTRTRGDAEWRIVAAIRCPDGNVYLRANFMGTWEAQRGLVESPVEVVVSA